METDNIRKLTENFFKSLNCDVSWIGDIMIVNNIPQDFEKLYEKSAPYIFSFDEKNHNENTESELITKGSILLKLMASYLDNKANTTILKIDFTPDLKDIVKNAIDFKDIQIIDLKNVEMTDYIFRFIFMTTLQYLNEKEQIMTQIYINNNTVLDHFDINDYPTVPGKIEEKKKEKELVLDTKANYNIAKENLKSRLQTKTKEITDELTKALEKALDRVNSHYTHLINELDNENRKNIENLEISRQKLPNANAKNKPIIEERIKRLEETIKNSKINEEIDKLVKEKEFFLTDEKHKHSINLNNSLMNTTVIYYPINDFKLFLKNKNQLKDIKFTYNPLKKELSRLFCDNCKIEIKELFLCESGHVSCKDCLEVCPRCQRKVCLACKQLKCNVCSGKICEKCATLCSSCNKYICNSDIKKDSISGKNICSSCAEFCNSCNKFSDKKSFRQCDSCRKKLCMNCIKTKYVDVKSQKLCTTCANTVKPKKVFSPF